MKLKTFGKSMEPFFRDGDVLEIKKTLFSSIKIDDFVTVKNGKNLVTHRVIYKHPKGFFIISKGDNNLKHDGKIFPKQVLGKVFSAKRDTKLFEPDKLYLIQSTIYYREIVNAIKLFDKANIDYAILKGLPLYLHLFKSHPKRVYADCDLLINQKDYPQAIKTLKKTGYRVNTSSPAVTSLIKIASGFPVMFDVHKEAVFLMTKLQNLAPLYPPSYTKQFSTMLLKEKVWVTLNNNRYPILSSENLFVYLLLHLFHHNYKGYYRFEMVKSVLKLNLNFEKISKIISEYKLKSFIYPAVAILKNHYGVKFPTSFITSITPQKNLVSYINKGVLTEDIFSDELRIHSGVKRFIRIYRLSPQNEFFKPLVFFDWQVVKLIFWVIWKRLSFFLAKLL